MRRGQDYTWSIRHPTLNAVIEVLPCFLSVSVSLPIPLHSTHVHAYLMWFPLFSSVECLWRVWELRSDARTHGSHLGHCILGRWEVRAAILLTPPVLQGDHCRCLGQMCCKHWGSVEPCIMAAARVGMHDSTTQQSRFVWWFLYVWMCCIMRNFCGRNFCKFCRWRAIREIFSVNILHFYARVCLYTWWRHRCKEAPTVPFTNLYSISFTNLYTTPFTNHYSVSFTNHYSVSFTNHYSVPFTNLYTISFTNLYTTPFH